MGESGGGVGEAAGGAGVVGAPVGPAGTPGTTLLPGFAGPAGVTLAPFVGFADADADSPGFAFSPCPRFPSATAPPYPAPPSPDTPDPPSAASPSRCPAECEGLALPASSPTFTQPAAAATAITVTARRTGTYKGRTAATSGAEKEVNLPNSRRPQEDTPRRPAVAEARTGGSPWGVRFDSVPMPASVEARPRDSRGYPVPAITPWEGDAPQFALTDYGRSAECARNRRCSVCGTLMPRGPVWRVVGAAESAAIRDALAAGRPYRNLAPTLEGPGHRACMLYASMVCPYLARPNARRGTSAETPDDMTAHVVRGAVRGKLGAVVGFADYEFAVTRSQVLFRFLDVVEFLPHDTADEHLAALRAELARADAGPDGRSGSGLDGGQPR